MATDIGIPPARKLEDTPQKALADHLDDAQRAQLIKAKVADVQQRYRWTFEKAWNYVREIEAPELFLTEEESPSGVGSSGPPKGSKPYVDPSSAKALQDAKLDQAKRMLRAQAAQDIADELRTVREEHPGLELEEAWQLLQAQNPSLFASAAAMEDGSAWQPPKPPPIYRYDPNKKVSGQTPSLRTVLKDYGTLKVHGVGDDLKEGAVLVSGASHDEKLADEATKLMDKHPGALHRSIAEQLALDEDPKLAKEHASDDELQANQQRIKDWIKDWINAAPPGKVRTFRDGWSAAQKAHPEWFEVLTP
jgi:hypothetical protein